jgi:hypothetical protein
MIREVLQRPGRLRMRLTVVAAASALFALVVLAALVLPSLQHNLEQSRVAFLRTSVQAAHPEILLRPFGQRPLTQVQLQLLAATTGVARITVFTESGFRLSPAVDSTPGAPLSPKALAVVEESANRLVVERQTVAGGRFNVFAWLDEEVGILEAVAAASRPAA